MIIHQPATKFLDTEFACDVLSSSDKTAEIMAILIASSAMAATMR
jgi:hypothetical protein